MLKAMLTDFKQLAGESWTTVRNANLETGWEPGGLGGLGGLGS